MAKMNVRISREYVEDQASKPGAEPPKDYTALVLLLLASAAALLGVFVAAGVR